MTHKNQDLEAARTLNEFAEGFVEFAEFVASDKELSIYRRFCTLGARNLLYLQGELQLLHFQLKELDQADQEILTRPGDNEEKTRTEQAVHAWECFQRQAVDDPRQSQKMALILKLRRVMEEYGKLCRESWHLEIDTQRQG